MNLIAVLSLVAALSGGHRGDPGREVVDPHGGACPTWYETAPALGPGRPRAVALGGLGNVTVCRYLHAFSGGESIHHPPLKTNLVSDGVIRRPASVRGLARRFDTLTPYPHPRQEPGLCGNEASGGFYVLFRYQDGHAASLKVTTSGCRRVVAGRHGRTYALPVSLLERLTAIAPPYRQVH
ncbi:MAG TPA: hypothetical protein VHA76_15780 [Solirubrobacterales bacterium]|nr:hypothetical protein [Solirubrobacterales bacterium]